MAGAEKPVGVQIRRGRRKAGTNRMPSIVLLASPAGGAQPASPPAGGWREKDFGEFRRQICEGKSKKTLKGNTMDCEETLREAAYKLHFSVLFNSIIRQRVSSSKTTNMKQFPQELTPQS